MGTPWGLHDGRRIFLLIRPQETVQQDQGKESAVHILSFRWLDGSHADSSVCEPFLRTGHLDSVPGHCSVVCASLVHPVLHTLWAHFWQDCGAKACCVLLWMSARLRLLIF